MKYVPRLEIPESKNPYYNTKSAGGYSNAVLGKVNNTGKSYSGLNVLSNCVGYAYGRFHEAIGDKTMSYLKPVNAENFPEGISKCKTGKVPKLGAIICWQKGDTLNGGDGAGHVAVVEKIYSDGSFLVSESGYMSTPFWTEVITKKNNTYKCAFMNNSYKFRGFIYSPISFEEEICKCQIKRGSKGNDVKTLQEALNLIEGLTLVVDGIFGINCEKAVKDFQKKYNLIIDGIVGDNTWSKIDELLEKCKKPEGVHDLNLKVNLKDITCWATTIKDEEYIRLTDLVNLGLIKSITYNKTNKIYTLK